MTVAVRPAVPADAASLVGLMRAFNLEENGAAGRITAAELLAHGHGAGARFRTLVAEQAALVGYALFYPSYDVEHAAKGFYLQDLFVQKAQRGQGIGRALMAGLARHCLADGGRYLFWNAQPRNAAGRAFYRRIGAREEPVVTLSLQPDALARLAGQG